MAEAALFLSEDPLTTEDLADVMNLGSKGFVQQVIDEMKEELEDDSRGLKLVESDEGYELVVKSDIVDAVEQLAPHRDLNEAELRTLALVAYNAPVKQSEIVEVRGNRAYTHLKELERRGFISSEEEGRTKELGVTDHFLDYFDLDHARDFAAGEEPIEPDTTGEDPEEQETGGEESEGMAEDEAHSPDDDEDGAEETDAAGEYEPVDDQDGEPAGEQPETDGQLEDAPVAEQAGNGTEEQDL